MKGLAVLILCVVGTFAMQEAEQRRLLSLQDKMTGNDGEMPALDREEKSPKGVKDGERQREFSAEEIKLMILDFLDGGFDGEELFHLLQENEVEFDEEMDRLLKLIDDEFEDKAPRNFSRKPEVDVNDKDGEFDAVDMQRIMQDFVDGEFDGEELFRLMKAFDGEFDEDLNRLMKLVDGELEENKRNPTKFLDDN